MSENWSELPGDGVTSAPIELANWWTAFQDPKLDSLISRAILSNQDLKIAAARVREARAQRGVVSADSFPAVNTSGSYSQIRRSENSSATLSTSQSSSGTSGSSSRSASVSSTGAQELFQLGFDASWELDIFGGVRRAVEAADANISASEEDLRDVLVTLLAEVARNYLELRGTQYRTAIARENIKTQQQTLELTRARYEAGLSSELSVAQAQAQLANTEAQVPALESDARQSIHQLSVLLGQGPGALIEELTVEAPIPTTPPQVPIGLPSDLLRRRPDVRRAERQLAAATAQIGVATAELFPKFSLTGTLGLQSSDAGNLFDYGSRFYSLGPTIRWPVFDAGKIRANIRVQDARQEQALVAYEKAVLASLRDVEDALVAYVKEQSTQQSYSDAVAASRKAVTISNELYTKGLADFLNVLESQRTLYLSQDQLALSNQRVTTNLVALFKALGGGWEMPDN